MMSLSRSADEDSVYVYLADVLQINDLELDFPVPAMFSEVRCISYPVGYFSSIFSPSSR
jgi:hypothetical protein